MTNSVGDVRPQKRHYWTREDFEALIEVIPGSDMTRVGSEKSGISLVYPKHTEGAAAELKIRGLDCDGYLLQKLIDEGVVAPKMTTGSQPIPVWDRNDIDTAAEWLYENDRWSSWTHFCWVANLRYGQAVKAHRVACVRNDLGFQVGFDVPGLVTVNPLRQAVTLQVDPRLSNTVKFKSKASSKHWYLFAAPINAPMVAAFLQGKQEPTVEFYGLTQDVNTLAVSWRVYHDFGAALVDPRAAVRSKGQA